MIDSGANPNCISLRCVRGSDYLNSLARSQYSGQQIVDANGENIEPCYVLKCSLKLGTPSILIKTEFVVIETLPFSCIIGQTTLATFMLKITSHQKDLHHNRYIVSSYQAFQSYGNLQELHKL